MTSAPTYGIGEKKWEHSINFTSLGIEKKRTKKEPNVIIKSLHTLKTPVVYKKI